MQHYSSWRVTFLTTGISIYDISNDCGYSSQTYTEKNLVSGESNLYNRIHNIS
ncbi:TPA: hypothetical protein ACVO16_001571 [Vibrio diabolicus]|uniref:hypothetical protein n=1 Tax=Vibrio sp. VGrn 2 TaxID=2419839 RepID=UPI00187A9ACA|nr:hypothetical protein [Vibrio sp. VGrn 2]